MEVLMSVQIKIRFSQEEWNQLLKICEQDLRIPPDEIRHIVRKEYDRITNAKRQKDKIKEENLL